MLDIKNVRDGDVFDQFVQVRTSTNAPIGCLGVKTRQILLYAELFLRGFSNVCLRGHGPLCRLRYPFISRESRKGGWVNQAYNRLSTNHGHINDCKLDSAVYAGVCV